MRDYLEIGKIVSTHGLCGELNVDLWCDGSEFAAQFKTMYLGREHSPVGVSSCRKHGFQSIVKLGCCNDLDTAKTLVGMLLYFRRSDAKLPAGSYFEDDLIGLVVTNSTDGKKYGTLCAVYRTGANDVYAFTDASGKEQLFPAIPQVIDKVDIENGEIFITPPAGLFSDEN